jgi:hypothetical protein
MTMSFKILGLGACALLGSLLAGCGTGDDNNNNATGGGGNATGGSGNATGGAGGGAMTVRKLYTFDDEGDPQGFSINTFATAAPYVNLGALTPPPTVSWGSKDFDAAATNKGCLVVEAKFTGWNQSVTVEVNGPLDMLDMLGGPMDLSNSTLRMQLWLESGLFPEAITDAPGGAVFFVKSGKDYTWGSAPWDNLENKVRKTWHLVKFNTAAPSADTDTTKWDPSNPAQLGVQISSGGGNAHTAEEFGPELTTTIYIDQITVQKN